MLEETEKTISGQKMVFVKHRFESYQRIELDDLKGQAEGQAPLSGVLACVEGKFDRLVSSSAFALVGSNRRFVIAKPGMLSGVRRGENIWVGGLVMSGPRGEGYYLQVTAIVKLPPDANLIAERYDKYVAKGDWEGLFDLVRWIVRRKQMPVQVSFADVEAYREFKDRANRQALTIWEASLKDDDAKGHYSIAEKFLELLKTAGRPRAEEHLRQCLRVDPDHREAGSRLQEFGYVRFEGRWMTRDEKRRMVQAGTRVREAAEERPQAATTEAPEAEVPGERTEAPIDQPARAGEKGVTEPAGTVGSPHDEESGVLTLRRAHVPSAANQGPSRPSMSSPSAGQAAVDRNPTITAGAFSDPEADAHSSSDWDIFEDVGLTSRVASSLNDGTNLTSIVVNATNVTFEGSLAGETALAPSADYWVRVRYRDQAGASSDWSDPRHFATAASRVPSEPPITALDGAEGAPLPTDEDEELDPLLRLLESVQTGRAAYEDRTAQEDQPEIGHTSGTETVERQDEEEPLSPEEIGEKEGRGSFRSGLGARFGMSVYPHVTTDSTEARFLGGVYCHFAETTSRRFECGLDFSPSAVKPEENFYYLLRLGYLRYLGERRLSYWTVGCGGISESLYDKQNVFGFAEVGLGNARLLGIEAIDARITCQIPFGSDINSVLVVLVTAGCEF